MMALMDPPTDWKFTHLLADLCRELGENDLGKIKVLFRGIVKEDVRTWTELVDVLLTKGFLYQYNIVYLQKIVIHLERQDLLSLLIEYAKESENKILHFEHRSIEIGYRCQTHGDMDRIRRVMADILLVEKQDVIFAGIQETSSVLITLLLPTLYVKALKELLESDKKTRFMAPLGRQGIDEIHIHGIKYQIDVEELIQPNEDGKKMISQLQRQVAQQDQQIKMMERELLLVKRSQSNVLNSTDLSSAPEEKGKKRKYLPEQIHEEQRKKFKSDDDLDSFLSYHEKPESERRMFIKPVENTLTKNLVKYAGMSTTLRKMISKIPENLKMKNLVPAMTPEQINTMCLYAKLNRIYPPVPTRSMGK